jgi:hypothetical protein
MNRRRAAALVMTASLLSACATVQNPSDPNAPHPHEAHADHDAHATHGAPGAEARAPGDDSDHAHPGLDVRERSGTRQVPAAPSAVEQMDLPFSGQSRGAAKTSIAAASIEEFATLEDLLDSLPPDATMLKQSISRDSERQPEEVRNVKVREAWLYAARLEDDHDVRLIIGTNPRSPRFYLVAVATALPPATSPAHEKLRAVREGVFEALGHRMPGRAYGLLTPPVRVQIEGSLLYEIERLPGTTAPQRLRPTTAWEIHPITSLEEAP